MANWNAYPKWKEGQVNGSGAIDFDDAGTTIKIALVTSLYTPDNAHDFFNDITNEVTGSNYTAGGAAVGSKSITLVTTTVTFDGANVTWTSHASGFSNARRAILYKDTGVSTTSNVIAYSDDFGADKGNTGGDLTLDLSAGLITW